MKRPSFFYSFTKGQRKGILALLLLIVLFQAGYFVVTSVDFTSEKDQSAEEREWLALQSGIDSLKAKKTGYKDTIYPFDPNYISDFKGYTLGLSTKEIDRLHKFRKSGKYINSVAGFRQVTGVSDSLLAKLSPYFKFPDWVAEKGNVTAPGQNNRPVVTKEPSQPERIDINEALEEDLVKVYGIGPYYAKQLLRRRADLGAFVSMGQMDDFTEFSDGAISGLKERFMVAGRPQVNKINVNTASLQQLSRFPYFNRDIGRAVITQRSMNGKITDINELLGINGFPVDKVEIIALYLEF